MQQKSISLSWREEHTSVCRNGCVNCFKLLPLPTDPFSLTHCLVRMAFLRLQILLAHLGLASLPRIRTPDWKNHTQERPMSQTSLQIWWFLKWKFWRTNTKQILCGASKWWNSSSVETWLTSSQLRCSQRNRWVCSSVVQSCILPRSPSDDEQSLRNCSRCWLWYTWVYNLFIRLGTKVGEQSRNGSLQLRLQSSYSGRSVHECLNTDQFSGWYGQQEWKSAVGCWTQAWWNDCLHWDCASTWGWDVDQGQCAGHIQHHLLVSFPQKLLNVCSQIMKVCYPWSWWHSIHANCGRFLHPLTVQTIWDPIYWCFIANSGRW